MVCKMAAIEAQREPHVRSTSLGVRPHNTAIIAPSLMLTFQAWDWGSNWCRSRMESPRANWSSTPPVDQAGQFTGIPQLASRPVSDLASVIHWLDHELGQLFSHIQPRRPISWQ